MALGGDARITLDEQSGLNSYGCAPKPVPAISYASSTASTVSAGAFAQARAFHFQLHQASQTCEIADVYADALEDARRRIRLLYRLDAAVDIAFGPSGTDLEYLVLATALGGGSPVCNIIVEVDEVGSGCLHAQQGRYFAPHTALGLAVETGQPVRGFDPERIRVEAVKVRNPDGGLRDLAEREAALVEVIAAAITAGRAPAAPRRAPLQDRADRTVSAGARAAGRTLRRQARRHRRRLPRPYLAGDAGRLSRHGRGRVRHRIEVHRRPPVQRLRARAGSD
jgi:hypothetical protein